MGSLPSPVAHEEHEVFLPFVQRYMINVATDKNGVGYGPWTHIDGWSEGVVDYIREFERELS